MTLRTFTAAPATIVLETPEGTVVQIAEKVEMMPMPEESVTLMVFKHCGDEVRQQPLSEVTLDMPGQLEGWTIPNHRHFMVRATTEHDAVASEQIRSSYPLPVVVIAAYIGGRIVAPHLEALVNEQGQVMTVMLVSDAGMYLRYSGQWVDLLDVATIDGYFTVDVRDEALIIYDTFDQAGQAALISQLPVVDAFDLVPYAPGGPELASQGVAGSIEIGDLLVAEDTADEAAEPPEIPIIETARDVPAAIELARQYPSIRWYVERRIDALGLSIKVNWDTP